MKNNNLLKSLLCLALLLAVMAGCVLGVNAFTAPIVAENERRAEEARLAAEKEKLGDSVMLFDRADPENAQLTVTAETVQKVYRDEEKQVYILSLSTTQGYTKDVPIELTLVVDFEGRIVSLTVDSSGETRELSPEFLPSFEGQDSTLAGVELVAGVTFSSSAIKNAVNDGFETLVANGLFAAAQKSDEQLIQELIPVAYPGIVNAAGAIQGEELAGSGSVTGGYRAGNGSGCLWFAEQDGKQLLAVYTLVGGLKILSPAGEDVTETADPALAEELRSLSAANLEEIDPTPPKGIRKVLPDDAEPVPVEIPGLSNTVVAAWKAETAEGSYYAFIARPYGFYEEESGGVMEVYFALDAQGAISGLRVKSIYLGDFYDAPDFSISDYREGFLGSTAETFNDDATLIAGATISSGAMKTATHDVFEAFALLTGNRR